MRFGFRYAFHRLHSRTLANLGDVRNQDLGDVRGLFAERFIGSLQFVDAPGLLFDDDAGRLGIDRVRPRIGSLWTGWLHGFQGGFGIGGGHARIGFHADDVLRNAVKILPCYQRTPVPINELSDDLTIAHAVAAVHGFDGGRLPARHAAFDALVADEVRRQARFSKDFSRRLPRQVTNGAYLFEGIGVGDAILRDVGDRRQSSQ